MAIDLLSPRMQAQGLSTSRFATPHEAVHSLLAVQAQEYLGALWALGLRVREADEATIEQAAAERRIVRSWPMRGTLHWMAAEDVRWLLGLLAPRGLAKHAARHEREYDLTPRVLGRSRDAIVRALEGGRALTREALYAALEAKHIATGASRGLHILFRFAHEGLICHGPRAGKQPTFVLLDEWLPPTPQPNRDEALAQLAQRYFCSHGPATLQDFVWWTGLLVSEAKSALEMVKSSLQHQRIDERDYWSAPDIEPAATAGTLLLPAFDEYTVAYSGRDELIAGKHAAQAKADAQIFKPVIVSNGRVIGNWKRTLQKGAVTVTALPFAPLSRRDQAGFNAAAERYAAFLGLSLAS